MATQHYSLKNCARLRRVRKNPPLGWQICVTGCRCLSVSLIVAFACCPTDPTLLAHAAEGTPLTQEQAGSPSQLLQRGREAYSAGQFARAAEVWKQAADAYRIAADPLNQAKAQSNLALAYQQLGLPSEADAAIAMSLALLQKLPESRDRLQALAQAWNTQSSLQRARGQLEQALLTQQHATEAYAQAEDEAGRIRSQLNTARLLQEQGLTRKSLEILAETNLQLQGQPDSHLKAVGLRELGTVLPLVDDRDQLRELLDRDLVDLSKDVSPADQFVGKALGQTFIVSQRLLEQSLKITRLVGSPTEIGSTALELANLFRTQYDSLRSLGTRDTLEESVERAKRALDYYRQAGDSAVSPTIRAQALVNRFSLAADLTDPQFQEAIDKAAGRSLPLEMEHWNSILQSEPEVRSMLDALKPSRSMLYTRVHFAESLSALVARSGATAPYRTEVINFLKITAQQAGALSDTRSRSYALGALGNLYEKIQQSPEDLEEARRYTEEALLLAQGSNAPEIAYRWQWQLGRLLKAQEETEQAIAIYREAFETLKGLRNDLILLNPQTRFTFREEIEPSYREFAGLLLKSADDQGEKGRQSRLEEAREVIEELRLTELVNYLNIDCEVSQITTIDEIDSEAAVLYPILLADRIEVILSLPGQPLQHHSARVPAVEVERLLQSLQKSLENPNSQNYLLETQKLYDWLIRPIEADLARNEVKTLVFVLDGALRNLPMSVLHDGQQYLIKEYAIALAPALTLFEPQPLVRQTLRATLGGLTEAKPRFRALENVEREIEQISSIEQIQVAGKILLNETFNQAELTAVLESSPAPIVHFATHGQFSSVLEDTYLLTWDGGINVEDLKRLLEANVQELGRKVELLVLSACETAQGDDRAALGLAGIAVRAGASATLASLWAVADESTAVLMGEFYQEWVQSDLSKAEALQQAQLKLLETEDYSHPYFWSPFVLVGNWL